MIPFGPWRPDAAAPNAPVCLKAQNVRPSVNGFLPLKAPVSSASALQNESRGAVTVRLDGGAVKSYAGTTDNLYSLQSDITWDNVSNKSGYDTLIQPGGDPITTAAGDAIAFEGAAYTTSGTQRWQFETFGDLLVATNFVNSPQKLDVTGSGDFADLGGSPPKARYITVVRDFLVLGCIENNERRVQWSAINNAEGWTPGTDSSDFQDFPAGGPVRGLIGGETGYVWLTDKVFRMVFVPGSEFIFQFDEIEGGRGLRSPYSLVKWGSEAFYRGTDGFYRFDLASGASQQIGVGKWARFFEEDQRAGTDFELLGGVSPNNRAVMWAYVSRENPGLIPNRLLIYDWVLDEATYADVNVETIAEWLTQGYSLDGINSFGTLDALPYSLDSPFWQGGQGLIGLFNASHVLTHLQGDNMEASIVTNDAFAPTRVLVQGTRPHIDASTLTVEIAAREGDGDSIVYEAPESLEDTGEVPAHTSGNYVRARITVPSGEAWTRANGIETMARKRGRR